MRTLLCIGIGMGEPDLVTPEAARALARADVVFAMDKGRGSDALNARRRSLYDALVPDGSARFVTLPDPVRDRESDDYLGAVGAWTDERAERYARFLRDELPDGGCAAFLVWGDPAFYDSTLRVAEEIQSAGYLDLTVEVHPGISSVQLLAARHSISVTRVGRAVTFTTGRRLRDEGLPVGVDDVVVFLDGECSFAGLPAAGLDIYWGANLGTPSEVLIGGPLEKVSTSIVEARGRVSGENGWVMDVYLLRRTRP
jgi:precorrin-6A synthase